MSHQLGNKYICDGCGKESFKEGLGKQPTGWRRAEMYPWFRYGQEVDFCPECWNALDEAIRVAVKVDRK